MTPMDAQGTGKSPGTRDEEERERTLSLLTEAAETATFHRVELERWERIGRAAGAALVQFDAAEPVEQVTPDMLVYATQDPDTADDVPSSIPRPSTR